MDEMSRQFAWTYRTSDGKAVFQIVPSRPRNPRWKSRGAYSEEKPDPASDIAAVMADSLKELDPERPIREANC
jgi:antitoxin (DNA-binding transcriptional repressor) of toxin-antitoxin stability system